jgi:hypothetical protein
VTRRRSPFDVILPLGVAGEQHVSAYVVLGTPNLVAARDFLTGTSPTLEGSVAAAQLVLWATLGVALLAGVIVALTRTVDAARAASRNALWSIAAVLIGAAILAAGVNHRSSSGMVTLSGGSLQEARAQLDR